MSPLWLYPAFHAGWLACRGFDWFARQRRGGRSVREILVPSRRGTRREVPKVTEVS